MNMRCTGAWIVATAVALGALTACSSRTVVESDLGIDDAPDWVNEGTQAVSDDNGRLIHGVGSAGPMNDDSLQIATADTRARAEVARVLSTYMDVMQQDFATNVRMGEGSLSDESVNREITAASKVVLNGARIIGRWRNEDTGIVYSIAELDMRQVKDVMQGVESMNRQLRTYLVTQGDEAFDRFAREGR